MEFGLTKALRNMRICIDSGFRAETHKAKFTIGTSRIKCIETRRATNEIGGFAQHAYVAVDDLVIVNHTHRFSLRRNKKETANCFVSATELCIALSKADAGVMEIVGEEDATPSGGYELVSTAPRNEGPWRRNLERLDSLDVDDDGELEDPR